MSASGSDGAGITSASLRPAVPPAQHQARPQRPQSELPQRQPLPLPLEGLARLARLAHLPPQVRLKPCPLRRSRWSQPLSLLSLWLNSLWLNRLSCLASGWLGYRSLNVLVCELGIGEPRLHRGYRLARLTPLQALPQAGLQAEQQEPFWLLVGIATGRSEVKTGFSLVVARLLLLGQLLGASSAGFSKEPSSNHHASTQQRSARSPAPQ